MCSLVIYLSEVESWCPRFPWRKYMKKKERRREKAVMQNNPDQLLFMLNSIPGSQPIRSRISNMWPYWKDGFHYMQTNKGNIDTRNKKKILVFIGELMDATTNMSNLTDDLLQWSDLLASLCVLGHDVTIKTDRVELLSLLSDGSQFTHRGCDKGDSGYDLIYIDILGLQQLVISAPDPATRSLIWSKYSCRLRVMTPFGMDAEFNYRDYTGPVMGERSQQGNWNLKLKQFLSKYPLSVDNSFLGFALKSTRNETTPQKTSMAFVHGKPSEFNAHKSYLKAIYKHTRIHTALSTGGVKIDLPFIVNHGNINLTSIRRLLRKSKVHLGRLLSIFNPYLKPAFLSK
ncbi:Alpha-1,6-mannosylglycoprotein 6-beta-N-acetylglucosaminyltransferase A [Desmophyllum pertusum]|uniref:alpha-1,6-mannosyl-glycoprotein 6-beta-N-acetylglucosaminyltransferase n=1 Tax=Desmophyllum pertusum TaxID=174260 RepID=A0A9X0CR22_9CNID|nr:Alpha-1,6-mannosylglycoprotein 6-beta-N-acetylglucosaminyltransferase A [Desmophyllum pertusum]